MSTPKAARLQHRGDGVEARAHDAAGHGVTAFANSLRQSPQERTIRAHIVGNTCTAAGHTVRGQSPVLALCRELTEAGHDLDASLEAFRGNTLCLTIRSIGQAAGLTVEDDRHGVPRFRKYRGPANGSNSSAAGGATPQIGSLHAAAPYPQGVPDGGSGD